MLKVLKLCLLFTIFFSWKCYSQAYFSVNDNYNYFIEKAVIDSTNWHSAIKPNNISQTRFDSLVLPKEILVKKPFSLMPISNFQLFMGKNEIAYLSQIGTYSFFRPYKTLEIRFSFSTSFNKYPSFIENKIDSNKVAPFLGRYDAKIGKQYFFYNFRASVNYSPKKYLDLSAGYDNHFFGDGYRSLFLSAQSSPYSYLSFGFHAWRLKYIALWAHLPDVDYTSGNSKFYGKYGAFHYLSVNLSNRINFGFFESVISWAKDTSTNRGVEWNYLNPFIFYRPIEYGIHSPDNATMGGSFKIRLWKKTYVYAQLFLDDLMVKELFKNNGWYGNKYAIQFGYKTYNLFKIQSLFFQQEINYVRPYVYGHSEPLHNYGVKYQALAHPFGANFQELLTNAKYAHGKWFYSGLVSFWQTGMDTSDVNYGQNIYVTSRKQKSTYGVYQLQGLKTDFLLAQFSANYNIHQKSGTYIFATVISRLMKNNKVTSNDLYFSVGVKTLLFHNDFDL